MKLYHEVQGEGEPLVLIAGLTADHITWLRVINALTEKFQVIVFDNAEGQSPIPSKPHSIS